MAGYDTNHMGARLGGWGGLASGFAGNRVQAGNAGMAARGLNAAGRVAESPWATRAQCAPLAVGGMAAGRQALDNEYRRAGVISGQAGGQAAGQEITNHIYGQLEAQNLVARDAQGNVIRDQNGMPTIDIEPRIHEAMANIGGDTLGGLVNILRGGMPFWSLITFP